MTTSELKSKIHADIDNLNDEKTLEIVNAILDASASEPIMISEKHIKFLEESEKSKTYTSEEAKKLVNEWLKD